MRTVDLTLFTHIESCFRLLKVNLVWGWGFADLTLFINRESCFRSLKLNPVWDWAFGRSKFKSYRQHIRKVISLRQWHAPLPVGHQIRIDTKCRGVTSREASYSLIIAILKACHFCIARNKEITSEVILFEYSRRFSQKRGFGQNPRRKVLFQITKKNASKNWEGFV